MTKALIRRSVQDLAPYVPGEQPRSGRRHTIKLNANENPYPPSPRVLAALKSIKPVDLTRYPDPLSTGLRQRIARIHGCTAEEVFVGNGSDEILALCTRAFVEKNGTLGYFVPSYSLYPILADIAEVGKMAVWLGPDFHWVEPSPDGCSLFFVTNPNAPTGMLFPRAEVERFCRVFSGVVVVDEAYVDFARENLIDLALNLDNVLVVRTLSKSFSLAGVRVGYAVGHRDLIGALMKIKDSFNVNVMSQRLALAALSDLPHMRRNVRRICRTREKLRQALEDLGWYVYPSEANFVLTRPKDVPARQLFEQLRERGIFIRYFPGKATGDCVRITVGTDDEIGQLLKEVRTIITDMAHAKRRDGDA
ncbi:MAG: histidinol-phosphate transaminase [Kiritimatiellae bacterium]|nr:histidinol-phosphate transaminase [Kiritimatiellia bacterium]